MIKLENTEVLGWEAAIRGARNPMNSWDKSDTRWSFDPEHENSISVAEDGEGYSLFIGPNDRKLMMNLAKAGSVEAKYRRMIVVTVDITAPLYWWKEFDTYKVGTVANSCSTMHKIHAKEFTPDDFSCEHLGYLDLNGDRSEEDQNVDDIMAADCYGMYPIDLLSEVIDFLNRYRTRFLETKDKRYWWQMIQLLPSSYNQRRTVMLNYEVLANIYPNRKNHKLDCWHVFCDWIKSLPYSEIITLEE